MEQAVERKLLYYQGSVQLPMNWYGEPIYKSMYKDVKTGENIILNSCSLSQDISKTFGEHYYSAITDAAEDFDVLWISSEDELRPIEDHFIHVQAVYQKMLSEGVSPQEINEVMIKEFVHNLKDKKY